MIVATFDENKKQWFQVIPYRPYYRITEVATILMINSATIYQYIRRGSITAYKVEGTTMIAHDDLINYIDHRTNQREPEIVQYIQEKLEELKRL